MANRGGAAERTSAWARPHSCARACSRSRAPSTAAPSAWAGTTKPGGTGSPAAVMAARLAPFPPASRTSVQRSSSNQTTSLIENRHRPHGLRGHPAVVGAVALFRVVGARARVDEDDVAVLQPVADLLERLVDLRRADAG